MERFNKVMEIASQNSTIRRGLTTSLIVGTILSAVNQGNIIFSGQVSLIKIFITYATPFIVSIYTTTTALLYKANGEKNL